TPVGLMSYVHKGYREVEIYSREISAANIALKTGVHDFYNIFTAGAGSWQGGSRWLIGYGVGSKEILSKSWNMNVEFTANWLSEQKKIQAELSLLSILDLGFEYNISKSSSISLGPSVNFWISEWKDQESAEFLSKLADPYASFREEIKGTLFQAWIGAKLGLHF